MKVEWSVDRAANRILWERLTLLPSELLEKTRPGLVLDLGGGTGDFAAPLKTDETTVVVLDSDDEILRKRVKGVQGVLGNAIVLPFKDGSLDAVAARAILHHIPTLVPSSLKEVKRILRSGGLFLIQEPLAGNCLANLARKFVSTDRHEEGERPLDHLVLKKAVEREFEVVWQEYHFLLSYLYPHIIQRLPGALKSLARWKTGIVNRFDIKALESLPRVRKYAAYISILCRKT